MKPAWSRPSQTRQWSKVSTSKRSGSISKPGRTSSSSDWAKGGETRIISSVSNRCKYFSNGETPKDQGRDQRVKPAALMDCIIYTFCLIKGECHSALIDTLRGWRYFGRHGDIPGQSGQNVRAPRLCPARARRRVGGRSTRPAVAGRVLEIDLIAAGRVGTAAAMGCVTAAAQEPLGGLCSKLGLER